jgi:cytochrome b6-f complex iron-sulfur subunit
VDSSPHLTRRHLVLGAGAGAGAVALAACSGGSTGSSGYGAGAGASSGSASGAGSAGSGTAAGGGAVLAALADIPVGTGVVTKDAAGAPIVVARPTAGTAAAFSAICTHLGCTVTAAGKQLDCPCHGSQYNAATGAVLRGPAPKPLLAVAVHVVDGKVVSGAA